MANATESTRSDAWLAAIGKNSRQTATNLFILAGLLLVLALGLGFYHRPPQPEEGARPWLNTDGAFVALYLWAAALALASFVGALWFTALRDTVTGLGDADIGRLSVLIGGGLLGALTVILGLRLTVLWWDLAFVGDLVKWRANWDKIAWCVLTLFGGLLVMFVSLQLARTEERSNALLRRLLYGFNAALSCVLLLAILTVLNVLTYAEAKPFAPYYQFFNRTRDWTEAGIYTLRPQTETLLKGLEKPVTVYLILSSRGRSGQLKLEMRQLLEQARVAAGRDKFDFQVLSPDLDDDRLKELAKKYKLDREGILVVYGVEGSQQSDFIPDSELGTWGANNRLSFSGENTLRSKLSYLIEGKKVPIYFTQGHGEPGVNSFDPKQPGLGSLRGRLERDNYEVKELNLGPGLAKIPEDATVIVVVTPTIAYQENDLKALREFLNPPEESKRKKGKLLVLLESDPSREGVLPSTGLEGLLAEHNVQVGNNRILGVPTNQTRSPLTVVVTPSPSSTNPVADAFMGEGFLFSNARTVEAQATGQPGVHAQELMVAVPGTGIWAETNLKVDPVEYVNSFLESRERFEELRKKVTTKPLPVAVAVSEGAPAPPPQFHGRMPEAPKQQPRLVVFGSASWVGNRELDRRVLNYDLFDSTLNWLREHQEYGKGTDERQRKEFTLDPKVELGRMWWLPGVLMVLGIVALGGGIWIVRRR